MKKLVFGLIATVMFGFVGNSSNPKINLISTNIESYPVIYCRDYTLTLAVGPLEVSTPARICCGFSFSPLTSYITCWEVSNKPAPNTFIAYAALTTLDIKVQDYIKNNNLKSIPLTKSILCDFDGVKYNLLIGSCNIVEKDGLKYIELTANKQK